LGLPVLWSSAEEVGSVSAGCHENVTILGRPFRRYRLGFKPQGERKEGRRPKQPVVGDNLRKHTRQKIHQMRIGYKPTKSYQKLAIALVIVASAICAEAQSAGPSATPPYTVSVFAGPPAGLTNPDSITTANGKIYVVYANATNADGTGGFSTIVEYSPTGQNLGTFQVLGKADGLKYNPFDHKLWALRDEDSNPALTLIDPKSRTQTDYTYAQLPPVHGGGYDDVVFMEDETFISASNPNVDAKGQNNSPSIVKARLVGHQVFVTPVLQGNASLIDIATGNNVVSLQSDPDSLKVDSAGDLVLDSQADGDLIFINAPGSPNQAGLRLHLSNGTSNQITVDDTVFPTTPSGTIYVVDTKGDTVYAVKSDAFQPGGAYSASDSDGILGKVDLSTGLVTPIVTGMQTPHGALFISAVSEGDRDRDGRDRDGRDRDGRDRDGRDRDGRDRDGRDPENQ
jgi:hypothetical protein